VETRSLPESLGPEWFSNPLPFDWKAADGTIVHGNFFPPAHPHVNGAGLPPCILSIHGGPSSIDAVNFDPEVAYFTSRGYAFARVDYRGSNGYGRGYLQSLYGHWGEYDVEDAAGATRALTAQGLADPARMIIMGGSAGGYTVLNALIRYPQVFKAGVARYPVGNLFTLDQDTHKFEAHYTAALVGELPGAAERYHAWSPVFHFNQLRTPLALFQGTEDKVVPPSQAGEIVAALRAAGVPYLYKLYEGEGHGFRKAENIEDYFQSTERFLQQYVLFAP
jgi:dipeptidyl aminopeptidase/acylaminoacyl peptidase